ncbi:MAG: DUF411 domain-containing protein [Alphaproteobacteria bacterium]|nr:DUF411 domain-containing protein [Alphaproteobacteria bacterium]
MCRTTRVSRRNTLCVLGAMGLTGSVLGAARAAEAPARLRLTVNRDPNCGCCSAWAAILEETGRFDVEIIDRADLTEMKAELGIPADLASCHTAVVEGYLVEGHVPAADIERLLELRPEKIRGIAVPGMPIGSPGMEMEGRGQDAFEVIAFADEDSRSVFARYPAR